MIKETPYALIKITTSGDVTLIGYDFVDFDFHDIYDLIDCNCFEIVNIHKTVPLGLMVVDESGLFKDKPINQLASVLYGNTIVGDVVIGVSNDYYINSVLEPDVYTWDYITAHLVAGDLMSLSNLIHGNYTA